MSKHSKSIENEILRRISDRGPGFVFTASDFLDLGSRDAVDQALSRNRRSGNIQKVARGIYYSPEYDSLLGKLSATSDAIAQAMARRDASRLQPSGGYAANILGLTTQVPMKVLFLTDGRSCRAKVGKGEIILKHTTPRNMATAGRLSGTIIQALRWLGKRHVDDRIVSKLKRNIPYTDRQQLLSDVRFAPAWIAAIMKKIATE